jgi:hypothetical protein
MDGMLAMQKKILIAVVTFMKKGIIALVDGNLSNHVFQALSN